MNAEFFVALDDLEREKGIPKDYMLEKIEQALLAAVRRDKQSAPDNFVVEINKDKKNIAFYAQKTVVETVTNSDAEISLSDAQLISPRVEIGGVVNVDIKTKEFGRIAAQTAKQVIIQAIREAERGMTFKEFTSKEHEILTGVVSRIDPKNGAIVIEFNVNGEKTEGYLLVDEQVKGEIYSEGDHIKVYLVEVKKGQRGMRMLLSRTHPGLIKRLFELEVPEIHDGLVQVNSIAREAGSRSKLAVWSDDSAVDAIGACVGPRGVRVGNIVAELNGEKIDIIKYSEDPAQYITAALAPAAVTSVELLPGGGKVCRVVVPNDQLSLAIGKEGQNARLAAKLTGYKIDIKPETHPEADTGSAV